VLAVVTCSPSACSEDISARNSRSTVCAPEASTTERHHTPPLAEMAADYIAAARDLQPRGPYLLGGYCMGAPVAVEMARRLEEDGERVAGWSCSILASDSPKG
jgi:surfactin synthase thioesterase subunit